MSKKKNKNKKVTFNGESKATLDTFESEESIRKYLASLTGDSEINNEEGNNSKSILPKDLVNKIIEGDIESEDSCVNNENNKLDENISITFGKKEDKNEEAEETKNVEIDDSEDDKEDAVLKEEGMEEKQNDSYIELKDTEIYDEYLTSVSIGSSGEVELSVDLSNVNLNTGTSISEKITNLHEPIEGNLDSDAAGEIVVMCFKRIISSMAPYAITTVGYIKDLLKDIKKFNKKKYFMVFYPVPLVEPDDYIVSLYKISENSYNAYQKSVTTLHDYGYPSTNDIISILKNFTEFCENNSFLSNEEKENSMAIESDGRVWQYMHELRNDSMTELTETYNQKVTDIMYNKYSEDFDDYFMNDEDDEIGGALNDEEPFLEQDKRIESTNDRECIEQDNTSGEVNKHNGTNDGKQITEEKEVEIESDFRCEENQTDFEEEVEEIDSIEIEEGEYEED